MQTARKRRLGFILLLVISISIAVILAMFALRKNIDLYYTPSQVFEQKVPAQQEIRLGGYVLKGSLRRKPKSLIAYFTLSDFHRKILVMYDGILPSLFREGQGVVAQGKMNSEGVFIADQVLAKHDSTYKPPGIEKHDS
jgi:cytochrome c-type biogenesis protein CcmE